jgi:hypothetical protein
MIELFFAILVCAIYTKQQKLTFRKSFKYFCHLIQDIIYDQG